MKKELRQSDVLSYFLSLQQSLPVQGISIKKLSLLVVLAACILKSGTSCLYRSSDKIKSVLGGTLIKGIDYQGFIKFFCTGKGDIIQKAILQWLLLFLFSTCPSCHLVMDRTNWEYGTHSKNILCLGAIYYGCFIPLVWTDLNKKGNSTMAVRLALIKRLKSQWVQVLPFPPIHLSGDREFIGDFWLRQLVSLEIEFVIRVKKNTKWQVWFNGGIKEKETKISVLHRYMLKKGLNSLEIVLAGDYIAQVVIVENTALNPDEPFVYLITNIDDIQKATQLYRQRWKIECCFKHLKSNGFELEKQAFTAPHKIELLMAILVIVYAMAIYEGTIVYQQEECPMKIKNYKKIDSNGKKRTIQYYEKSVFRTGLSIIEDNIINVQQLIKAMITAIKQNCNCKSMTYVSLFFTEE